MKNFPFNYKGQEYWYSRACCCVSAIFCKNHDYLTCVLINRRGTATTQENHKWNLPVGYLDFNETLKQCAVREIFEETGVKVSPTSLKLYNINSKPDDGKQDIGFRYTAMLDGFTDDYPLSTKNMEKNEVESVMWLPISKLSEMNWAWNHYDIIVEILTKKYGIKIPKDNDAVEDVHFKYLFKCPNGGKVELYADSKHWGIMDYVDYSNQSYESNDTAENNLIKAINQANSYWHGVKPVHPDKILLNILKKVNKQ